MLALPSVLDKSTSHRIAARQTPRVYGDRWLGFSGLSIPIQPSCEPFKAQTLVLCVQGVLVVPASRQAFPVKRHGSHHTGHMVQADSVGGKGTG